VGEKKKTGAGGREAPGTSLTSNAYKKNTSCQKSKKTTIGQRPEEGRNSNKTQRVEKEYQKKSLPITLKVNGTTLS